MAAATIVQHEGDTKPASASSAAERYTPAHHVTVSKLKPITLLGISTGTDWHQATFEFEGGFIRSMDFDLEAAWHPLFESLQSNQQRKLAEAAALRRPQEDGTVIVQNTPIWFWTRTETKRGRFIRNSHFDVPLESYSEGRVTGTRAARDLFAFIRIHQQAPWLDHLINGCLEEAFFVANAHFSQEASRSGAASAFCTMVSQFFRFGVQQADVDKFIEHRLASELRSLEWWIQHHAKEKQEFVQRMSAARAAKRGTTRPAHLKSLETSHG